MCNGHTRFVEIRDALAESKAALRAQGLELWLALLHRAAERGGGGTHSDDEGEAAGADDDVARQRDQLPEHAWAALAWWRRGDADDPDARSAAPKSGETPYVARRGNQRALFFGVVALFFLARSVSV